MKNTKEHIKILSALSLAASDTREDTLASIVINTLYQKEAVKIEELNTAIHELYGFEPYKDEINQLIKNLIENRKIEKNQNKEYSLPEDEKLKFQKSDLALRDKEKARFQNFKNFITDNLGANIEVPKIKLIWATFVEYIYNNFYEFGEEALKILHPHIQYTGRSNNNDFFQIGLTPYFLESDSTN